MKKLLKGSTDKFVLNLLKGAGMILPCTLVASCGDPGKDSNKGGDQKGSFVDKEEMIKFFIDNKKLSREEAEKIVTDKFFKENKDNKDALKALTRENLLGDSEALQKKISEEKQKIEQKKGGSNPTSQKTLSKGDGESINKKTPSLEGDEGDMDEKAPSIKLVADERIKNDKYLPIKAGVDKNNIVVLKVDVVGYDVSVLEAVSSNEGVNVVFDKDHSSIDVGIGAFGEDVLVQTTISLREKNSGKVWSKFELCLVDEAYKGYWEGNKKESFVAAANKCLESNDIDSLKNSLDALSKVDVDLFEVWNAIEGEKFRKNLNLKLDENKLSWGDKSFDNVKNNLSNVVDVLVAYNTIFPGNTVRFVLDETNIDLSAANIVDSLTELWVKLGANIKGEIWVGKSRGGDKFGFCIKEGSASVGEWDENIGDLKKCLDLVAGLKENDSLKNAEFLSNLFGSVSIVNGTDNGKIKVGVGDFVFDNCVDFKQFGTFDKELENFKDITTFVKGCFSFSIDKDNKVYLVVKDGEPPMEILSLENEAALHNLGKLVSGVDRVFGCNPTGVKIRLCAGDKTKEIKVGSKVISISFDNKSSFDKFVSSMSDIKKYWSFDGNLGDLELNNGFLWFGNLSISKVGKDAGFFTENGSWKKAVKTGIVGNWRISNLVQSRGSDSKIGISGGKKDFDFGKAVWKNGDIDKNVLGEYFIRKK